MSDFDMDFFEEPAMDFFGDPVAERNASSRKRSRKKKRVNPLVLILSGALVITIGVIIFLLAGRGGFGFRCEHEWEKATCVTGKVCKKCNETEGEALGHIWQEATREKPKTCTRCLKTEGDRLSIREAYPDGKLRFANGAFLMNTDDLLELYVLKLKENGLQFEDTGLVEERAEEYHVYHLADDNGNVIYVAVVTDLGTGQINLVSAGVPLDSSDLDVTNDLLTAATILYEVCHGAFSDEKWKELDMGMEYTYQNQSLLTRSSCDGLGYVVVTDPNHCEVLAIADPSNVLMQ
jgi:hypothetical protein